MSRYSIGLFTLILLVAGVYYTTLQSEKQPNTPKLEIKDALAEDILRTKDPELGVIPEGAKQNAIRATQRLQKAYYGNESSTRDNFITARWKERGPNNIGGRTRSILIDARDASRKTVFAGSVSGGIWRTYDITASPVQWEKINDFMDNLAIGALGQDPNNMDVMYAGTGEFDVDGIGIFRSTDGGDNWELLPETENFNFKTTRALLVHPVTSDVYAGTSRGVWRSTDQGETWEKVGGYTPPTNFTSNEIYDLVYANNGYIYSSSANAVQRSTSGDLGSWESMGSSSTGFPTGLSRIELAISKTEPNIMYIIGSENGTASRVYRSDDGGYNWTQKAMPTFQNGAEFTNGQAWYDLEISVDPFDAEHVVVGGVIIMRSTNGGFSWDQFATNMHVDQHEQLWDEEQQGVLYFGNDGGIWRSENGTSNQVQDKNHGYITTQFYACGIHPEAYKDYFIGGTQDNNSLQVQGSGVRGARIVLGGDGMMCHIDQNDPEYQMVSLQFGSYRLSTNEGVSFSGGVEVNGRFFNPSEYDDDANIMYSQTFDSDFARWQIPGSEVDYVDVQGMNLDVSTAVADPNTPNRMYFGTFSGQVIKVDNANEGDVVTGERVGPSASGTISSIYVEYGDPDHIIVAISNYGVESVYVTYDGGNDWVSCEGDLPNMPVRWAIFDPTNSDRAMIATETGVWVTEMLEGANTNWIPPAPNIGTPLVRTDMLQVRHSDNFVLAATYGRGLWTSDVFAEPVARMQIDQLGYIDAPLDFDGGVSVNASNYLWDFGDGTNSTNETEVHSYDAVGVYPISLTINGDLTTTNNVKILPDKSIPYAPGETAYSGDFESFTSHYGAASVEGSTFTRGNSTIAGKDGTHSGDYAYVLGIDEDYYQHDTEAMLYLPNFDLSEPGIYEFSFWAKYRLSDGRDGFQVQYSLDKGQSWNQLGAVDDEDWYNYQNTNEDILTFPQGASYFSGSKHAYDNFKLNISELAGQSNVAFRFYFKGGNSGNFRGLAIDDVAITKYEGELKTKLIKFEGEYTQPTEVTLSWNTQPEYFCERIDVERSFNGKDYETIQSIPAIGGTTTELAEYSMTTLGQRPVIFYRLKVVNNNDAVDYNYEFYSDPLVMQKDELGADILKVFPNPFQTEINLTFTQAINADIKYELFDVSGRLMARNTIAGGGDIFKTLTMPDLSNGVYNLRVTIGEQEPLVYKLLRSAE